MKINLIPEVKKEQLKIRNTNIWVTNIAIGIGVVLAGIMVVLAIYMGGVVAKIKSVESDTVTLEDKLKAYQALEQTVLSIEQGVKEVKQILSNEDKWQTVFSVFEEATPDDIRFKSLNISADLGVTAELEGKNINSIDRFIKSFMNYKRNEKSVFTAVEVGGYTTNEKGLVNFSATFKINQDALVAVVAKAEKQE
jgi:hypothetical protein